MASSVAKLREELLHLTGGKLDIQLDDKNFKSSFQILKELAEIWDEIGEKAGDITQANILNLLGGKRNANVLSSIITNFQDAIDASDTAADSMGSAWRENQKYLDSIEGKTKQMQASFETFANSVISSGVVKTFVDIQKAVLDVATALNKVGGLIPTITVLATIVKTIRDNAAANKAVDALSEIIKSGSGMDKAVEAFNKLTPSVQKLAMARGGEAIQEIGKSAGFAANATSGLGKMFDSLTSKVSGLGGALKSMLSSWTFWLSVIALVISGIRALINAQEEARQKAIESAKEQKKAYDEAKETYAQNVESLESLRDEYEKLSRGVDEHGKRVDLTAEEYERYLSIVNQVVDISPEVADGFNKEGAQLSSYTDLVDRAIEKEQELLDLRRQAMLSRGDSLFEGWNDSVSDLNKEYKDLLLQLASVTGRAFGSTDAEKKFEAFSKTLKEYGIEYAESYKEFRGSLGWLDNMSTNYDFALDVYDAWKNNHLIDALNATGEYNDKELNAIDDAIRAFAQIIPEYKSVRAEVADYLEAGFEEWNSTSEFRENIEDAEGALEIFKRGITDLADPNASLEQNRAELIKYAEAFSDAVDDVEAFEEAQTAVGTEGELFDATGFDNIVKKYSGIPQIAQYLAEARLRLKAGFGEADEELKYMTSDTEKLYELLGKMSSLETFVSGANANKPLADMLSSMNEFKELYNSILGKEIEDSDLFNNDEWNVGRITTYITEMVEAVTANNTFIESNPKLAASLLLLASTLGVTSDAIVSFNDALSAVDSVSDLKKSIDEFVAAGAEAEDADYSDLLSSLNGIIEKWNEIRKAQAESSGEEYTPLTMTDFLGADMNDWDLAKQKILEYKAAVITLFSLGEGSGQSALVNLLLGLDTSAQGATKSVYKLSDAVSALGDVQDRAQNGIDLSDPAKAISDAEKLAEEWNSARKKIGLEGNKTWKDILTMEVSGVDGAISELSERENSLKDMYTDIVAAFIDTLDATDEEKESLKNGLTAIIDKAIDTRNLEEKAEKAKNAFTRISDAYTFMSDHIAGERVGSIDEVYDDLEKLRELTGDNALKLTDFIKWDEDLGDFVYKTNTLKTAIDDAATTIATEMVDAEIAAGNAMKESLRTDEINKRANAIKRSLEGVIDTWGQLTSVVGNVKNMQSLKSDYNSYMSGDMSFLDMLSSTISLAEDLGISLDDAFSIGADGEMVVNIENMENGLVGVIDNLEKSGVCSANLAEQLKQAVRAEAELETGAEKIQKAYDKAREGISAGQDRRRAQQLTFEDYKSMIERDARYANTVEYVNGVMSINRDLYNETTKEIASETAQMALLEAAQRKLKIDELQKKLSKLTSAEKDQKSIIEKQIEKLKLEAKGYTILANEISNATNQFERFRNAAGDSEADTYMDAKSALKMINDVLFNVESELFGELGNEQFHEAIKLLIDPDVDFADPNWVNKVKEKLGSSKKTLEDWFGEGTEKNPQTTRSNMNSFWNYLVGGDFATEEIDEAGQHWGKFKENVDVESMAQHFGVTKDAMRAALQQLEKFSALSFDWEVIDPEYYAEVMAKAKELKRISDEANAEAERTKKAAEEARAEAEKAAKELEDAKKTGSEADVARLEAESAKAEESANAAEKAADEARAAADEAAAKAAEQEETSTDKLKKSLEDIIAQVETLTSEPVNIDFTKALEGAKSVTDELYRMVGVLTEINTIVNSIMSGGSGAGSTTSSPAGTSTTGIQAVGYIASAGVSDIPLGSGTMDKIKKLAAKYIPDGYNGNVDLTRRVVVPVEALAEVGWKGYDSNGNEVDLSTDGGWATLFSSTFTAGDLSNDLNEFEYNENVIINATPILADGTVLDEANFRGYIQDLLAESMETGESVMDLDAEQYGLILSFDVVGDNQSIEDAIDQANEWTENLHNIQEEWDLLRFENNFFGEADTLDPNHVVETLDANINTANEALDSLRESGAEGIDVDTEPAIESMESVIDEGTSIESMVADICNMWLDLDPNPAIDSIQVVIDSLEVLAEAVNDVNKLSLSTANTKKSSTTVTPYASGTDSAKGGKSLVGELGREMVVDVNSGRWYTVGNNGPEFVNLPKRAVVFNHEKTAELLGDTPIKLHGRAFASGTGNLAGTYNNSSVGGGMINIVALNTPEKQKETKKATAAYQEEVDTIESLAEAYKLANEQLEHLIKHEEQNYYIAERAANFDKMHTFLANEVEIYKKIMENSQRGIDALKAAGADDGNKELQELEEAYWSAYRSMYEALDNIRSLYSDALGEEVDDIQSAYKNLTNAVKEYNENGLISIDTFQAILDNGIEYLGLLQDENGMFDVSTNAVRDLLKYRKDQLAIETAIAYVSRLNEALKNGESQKVAELVNATGQIGRNTWDIVYANLELLKMQGLSDELYQTALDNIDKLRDLTDVTMDDFISEDAIEEAKERFDELNKQIEHYIAHQKFAYDVGERGMDFTAMNTALSNEVEYYKQIMDEAQKTIAELTMLGADDTNEALQSVEESYWSAYRSMYSALDSIRKLRVDALSDRLDSLTGAFGTLKKAADEYSKSGGISLDTLESLLSNGFQYMSLLDAQDGRYVINTERVNAYVNARKNQLAVENALSYISEVREAIENKESDRLQHLVDSMDAVTNSTWDYVYAQAALLKASMSGAQYDAFIANIDRMRTLADSVVYDYASGAGEVTEEYDKQSEALGDILKYTEDLIRAETKDKIDALNDQIEAYKKIIDLKKESIDKTKDENEYQEEVADRVKEIAELQAKADLLGLDTSRTASAERQKLLQDIADKQKDLAKYQQDYSIDAQKEALDKDLETYEEQKKAEIEELEKTISSEEKVYQLAIARIRDQWETLYADLIAWNTEEGSVINQEITEAWEAATRAVEKYGSAIRAMEAVKQADSGDNLVVTDIRKYHSGGIVGDQGSLNEKEVLAVLEKGEVVVTKPMKQALYTAVDFVHELGKRLGVKLDSIRNFAVGDLGGAFTPALAGAGTVPVTQNNNISFSPVFNVEFNGADIGNRDARTLGREIASAAADNLFDAFSKRGIDTLRTLRQ